MPEIRCRDVVRTYRSPAGAVEALRGVNATFDGGTLAALVGPSGCGKSTLLRLLAGLDVPDAGAVTVGGLDVGALSGGAARRYRRDVATYVAQRAAANLVPHLTLREQLPRHDGSVLERLGLAGLAARRVGELSGGEQARAALAVALLRDTPLLLADEPTAELDRDSAARVVAALRDAADAGRTVVVATHDPELVAAAGQDLRLERAEASLARAARAPAPGGTVLDVRGLRKAYGGNVAVDGVSLELAAGELGVLLGRSGSGKSTLLMAAGGWLQADAGAVEVLGRPQPSRPPWSETAYLAQRFGLLPELTAAENVGLPFRLAGTTDESRVAGLLEQLGLAELADRTPPETSIGQQQRTALARALAPRPALLLADEPTSHQDGGFAERVWWALQEARDEGTACLVATHDPAAAARGDRVWRIEDGRLSGYSSSSSAALLMQ